MKLLVALLLSVFIAIVGFCVVTEIKTPKTEETYTVPMLEDIHGQIETMETIRKHIDSQNDTITDLKSENNKLKEQVESLKKENSGLIQERNEVVKEYNNLVESYDYLIEMIEDVNTSML